MSGDVKRVELDGDVMISSLSWNKRRFGHLYPEDYDCSVNLMANGIRHEFAVSHETLMKLSRAVRVRVVLEVLEEREMTDAERIRDLEKRVAELEAKR